MTRQDDLARIARGLDAALAAYRRVVEAGFDVSAKDGGDPVTQVDLEVNRVLKQLLPAPGEGWLSEETVDDPARLGCARVWVVDPLDGTREFVAGIPEFCISIGLCEDGRAVAGGLANPMTGEIILGAVGHGVTLNGVAAAVAQRSLLAGAVVLASRSEWRKGQWKRFADGPFDVRPVGSVAWKMGLVAIGRVDLTWTLVPKNEWDVAGGTALVEAAGGRVVQPTGEPRSFNRRDPLLPGLVCGNPTLLDQLLPLLV